MQINNNSVSEITVLQCTCARCGGQWITRTKERPARCAKCKSANWWMQARAPIRSGPKPDPLYKRVRCWCPQMEGMQPGDELIIPWPDNNFLNPSMSNRPKINPAVYRYAQYRGWQVVTEGHTSGLWVKRKS